MHELVPGVLPGGPRAFMRTRIMRWSDQEFALYLRRRAQELTRHVPDARADPGAAVLAEAGLLEHIRALARRHGYLVYHTHDARRSEAGFPDLVLCRPPSAHGPGRLLFLECKTSTGQVTAEQATWLSVLAQVPGVVARVVRPQDLGAIEGWLQGEGA